MTYLRSLSSGRLCRWWHWCLALSAGWASTELTLFCSSALGVGVLKYVPYVGSLLFFVLGVGLVEEVAKALCAVVALKTPRLIEEPLSALQLSGGVALGFATAENILYATMYGDGVLVVRFVVSTLAHILFSALWGFALGTRMWKNFFGFLLLSAFAHGVFDWFLMSGRPVLAILTLVVLWMGFREAILGAYLGQEYRRSLPFEMVKCDSCSVLTRAQGKYCSHCGQGM